MRLVAMSRNYLLPIFTVIGCLTLTGWAEGHGGGKGHYYNQQATSSQSATPTKQLPTLQNPSDAVDIIAPCDTSISDYNSDLCQQWRMAEAADQMVKVSWAQLVLTACSLFALAITIFVTTRSNAIAREMGMSQTRAYVTVSGGNVTWRDVAHSSPQIVLSVENTGESPAIWFTIAATVFNTENQIDKSEFSEIDMRGVWPKRWNAIGPKASLTVPISTAKAMDLQRDAYQKREVVTLNVAGVVTYQTIFGEIYESEFWFVRRGLPGYHKIIVEKIGDETRVAEVEHKLQRPICILRSYRKIKDA